MINKLTPEIKGKAFDPGWFELRQRLEQADKYKSALEHIRDLDYRGNQHDSHFIAIDALKL